MAACAVITPCLQIRVGVGEYTGVITGATVAVALTVAVGCVAMTVAVAVANMGVGVDDGMTTVLVGVGWAGMIGGRSSHARISNNSSRTRPTISGLMIDAGGH
jgi:hypothetical protein